jgi:L-lactate dehydrogenase (cytochrome)
LQVINSIADLRELAQKRVPRALFEYMDRGSYDEVTLRRNRSDLESIQFRQRVLIDVAQQSLGKTILGQPASMPLAIGPTGIAGLIHADGEILAAQAAESFGIPFCLSTVSICSIEDVRAATKVPFWFQLYIMKDRGYTARLMDRAEAAGCPVLMMTVDIPVSGLRRRDVKNGLTIPPRLTLRNAIDIATKPTWALRVLMGKRKTFGNLVEATQGTGGATLAKWIATQFDSSVTWQDFEAIRRRWKGKLIIKGILDEDDARRVVDMGADALVVSNHGGRQLDGAPSTISALPRIVEAVGGRTEVMFDGGVRCGQDIVRALALGANSVLTGRAFLYGLGANGRSGVTSALDILSKEMQITLALTGCNDVREVGRQILV